MKTDVQNRWYILVHGHDLADLRDEVGARGYTREAPAENGHLLVSDSFHTDSIKAAFIDALLAKRGPGG